MLQINILFHSRAVVSRIMDSALSILFICRVWFYVPSNETLAKQHVVLSFFLSLSLSLSVFFLYLYR